MRSLARPRALALTQSLRSACTTPCPFRDSTPLRRKTTSSKSSPKSLRKQQTTPGFGHDPKSRLRSPTSSSNAQDKHAAFRAITLHEFERVLEQLRASNTSIVGVGAEEFGRHATVFMNALDHAFKLSGQNITQRDKNPLFWNLREAFVTKESKGLNKELLYSFQAFIIRQRTAKGLEKSKRVLMDFRYPHEWFPEARTFQRTIHLHVGPTNSGKTYNALKALENAKRGVYAGPLRLLAAEVYQRFLTKGRPVALVTGEEVRIPANSDQYLTSCTVEMVSTTREYDVAVIDEIQMLADKDRGAAWTKALLGLCAREVHLCGEERAVDLIKSLCASTGDEVIVHRYKRLSPLKVEDRPLKGLGGLTKGDAVIGFSRRNLHVLKRRIELDTGKRCAIIYGGLPPEVRVQQAALFNDPNNDYDFVVASDAIGMGLNLEIKRVILESISKYDGARHRFLTNPEIKQIGGRAGRYKTARNAAETGTDGAARKEAERSMGLVTAMERPHMKMISRAFGEEAKRLRVAYIEPPSQVIVQYASFYAPETPLSYLLMQMKTTAVTSSAYRVHISPDTLEIADVIQDLPMTLQDRVTFTRLPVASFSTQSARTVVRALASIIAHNEEGSLLNINEIPIELLDEDNPTHPLDHLHKLEFLHHAISQYLWLSYRFEGVFRDQELAFHLANVVNERLMVVLSNLSFSEKQLREQRYIRQVRAEKAEKTAALLGKMEEEEEGQVDGDALGGEAREGRMDESEEGPMGMEVKTPSEERVGL